MSNLSISQRLLSLSSDEDFDVIASESFNFQLENNAPYAEFVHGIGAKSWREAFLPIELFKSHRIGCHNSEEAIFLSSGTTSSERSKHHVFDLQLYRSLAIAHFEELYGSLGDRVVLALLPSYQEQGQSSLVWMVNEFIGCADSNSQFVGSDFELLRKTLDQLVNSKEVLLIGVSYALLDFAQKHSLSSSNLTIMETGGMKGRRKELTRSELHRELQSAFPESLITSEYGMTELLSQGYFVNRRFVPPKWMRAFTVNVSDPFEILEPGRRGVLAFADLANYHSCSFIQTRDIGVVQEDGTFTVEGRLDQSDIRGCNLLYT